MKLNIEGLSSSPGPLSVLGIAWRRWDLLGFLQMRCLYMLSYKAIKEYRMSMLMWNMYVKICFLLSKHMVNVALQARICSLLLAASFGVESFYTIIYYIIYMITVLSFRKFHLCCPSLQITRNSENEAREHRKHLGTCLLLGGYCLSDVRGDAAGLKVGDVNPFINPVLGNGVTWIY